MKIDLKWLVLNPTWSATLMTVACMVLFIKLGFWQLNKGQLKQAIEQAHQSSAGTNYLDVNLTALELKQLHTHKVRVKGRYDESYQILLDNQVYQQQSGFHVLTPFLLAGTDKAILINRGWVAGLSEHSKTPKVQTSTDEQDISGMLWLPSHKIFSLEESSLWKVPGVWQQLDIEAYQKKIPLNLLPVILKLDVSVKKDGFVRDWSLPPSKVASHFGYAYQWFGFAFAAMMIYLYQICTLKAKAD